jgi:hypothetical protein
MPESLEDIFGELARQVPTAPGETFEFTADVLPVPPVNLSTNRMFIQKVQYRYSGYYQVDSLWFHAYHDVSRQLGLLTLSAMFHSHPYTPIRLDLTHPASDIHHLMFEYRYTEFEWRLFYKARPYAVRYEAKKYEHAGATPIGYGFPLAMEDRIRFRFTNLEDRVSTDDEYQNRDTIWLGGSDRAYALLASILLDIGRPEEQVGMYPLDASGEEGAFLGLWSAETRFILPGSSYWRPDKWSEVGNTE